MCQDALRRYQAGDTLIHHIVQSCKNIPPLCPAAFFHEHPLPVARFLMFILLIRVDVQLAMWWALLSFREEERPCKAVQILLKATARFGESPELT